MSESQFSSRLRQRLFRDHRITCYRIESPLTQPGIADIHYVAGAGQTGWIETKQWDCWPSKMPYRPEQPIWLHQYCEAGGRAFTFLHNLQVDEVMVVSGWKALDASRRLPAPVWGLNVARLKLDADWRMLAEWLTISDSFEG